MKKKKSIRDFTLCFSERWRNNIHHLSRPLTSLSLKMKILLSEPIKPNQLKSSLLSFVAAFFETSLQTKKT